MPAPRAQTLTFKNGYALTEQPPVAAALAPVDHAPGATRLTIDLAPPASKLPGWLANDKKVRIFRRRPDSREFGSAQLTVRGPEKHMLR